MTSVRKSCPKGGLGKHGSNWHPIGQAFGQSKDIWFNIVVLISKELTSTTNSCLNLIYNEVNTCLLTIIRQSLNKVLIRRLHT